MSGSVDLLIETGAAWGIQITWLDGQKQPVPFDTPVMNVRQDLNPTAKLIARLDESAQFDGTLQIIGPGIVQASMTPEQTNALNPGYGFWDMFVNVAGVRARMVFGTMAIAAHVTELNT